MRRRAWPSFRLRTLLFVVAGIAIILGLGVVPAERQKKFVETTPGIAKWALRRDTGWKNWIPDRVRGFRGGHYFDSISELILDEDFGKRDRHGVRTGRVATSRWRQLRRSFPRLKRLEISGLRLDLSDLASAFGRPPLTQVDCLAIEGTGTVAEITKVLVGHPRLRELEIGTTTLSGHDCDWLLRDAIPDCGFAGFRCPINSDDLIARLCENPWLTYLELNASNCSDEAIGNLAQCKQLRYLTLTDASISPTTLNRLSKLPLMQSLTLIRTPIETQHLRRLSPESKIKHVRLTEVDCRSVDLAEFSAAPFLVSLDLIDCPVASEVDESGGVLATRSNGFSIRLNQWGD